MKRMRLLGVVPYILFAGREKEDLFCEGGNGQGKKDAFKIREKITYGHAIPRSTVVPLHVSHDPPNPRKSQTNS